MIAVDCLSGPHEILTKRYSGTRIKGICLEDYGILVEESSEEMTIKLLSDAMILMVKEKGLLKKYREDANLRALDFSVDVYKKKIDALIANI